MAEFRTLLELFDAIPDEDAAIAHFTSVRWRGGAFCPHCGGLKVYTFADKKTHKCAACGSRFSIKVGTIFEDSKVPLRKWLAAIWLLTTHKKGVASTTLARDIGVTQKTAWFMLHRLRAAAETKSFNGPLGGSGPVEADETFVGGKEKNKHASKRTGGTQGGKGKAVVFGMVERGGELRAMVVPDRKASTVQGIVTSHVAPGATLMTDEFTGFRGLGARYTHHTVNHAKGEYVRHYTLHTNTIEGAWSLLKRQIVGIHHFVSAKHLSRYVDEATWRYNRRAAVEGTRVDALIAGADGRLTYKALIA